MKESRPAVFLDRDGTLMEEVHYCNDPDKVRLFAGVGESLERLKQHGFANVVITNQSGIARGRISREQFEAVQARLLREAGPGAIDATYMCPHSPDDKCECRKPHPTLVLQAARELQLDLARSYFIGDKTADIECGKRAGVRTILVQTGYGREHVAICAPDFVAGDIVEAVAIVLEKSPRS